MEFVSEDISKLSLLPQLMNKKRKVSENSRRPRSFDLLASWGIQVCFKKKSKCK